MRFVERAHLCLSWPQTYNVYVSRRELGSAESRVYDKIAELYELGAVGKSDPPAPAQTARFFSHEPCESIATLFSGAQAGLPPAHLVCCYASYPLTDKINALLYMHKMLRFPRSRPVSFSDAGSLSPLVALRWAETVREDVWVICMEQIGEYDGPAKGEDRFFPKADAFALGRLSPDDGDWRILGYAMEPFDLATLRGIGHPGVLAKRAGELIDDLLAEAGIGRAAVTLVPRLLHPAYLRELGHGFKIIRRKAPMLNRGTADAFYGLSELRELDGMGGLEGMHRLDGTADTKETHDWDGTADTKETHDWDGAAGPKETHDLDEASGPNGSDAEQKRPRETHVLLDFTDPCFGAGCMLLRRRNEQ